MTEKDELELWKGADETALHRKGEQVMTANDWTHAICKLCWDKKEPGRTPVTLKYPHPETCCFCGNETKDGIYIRESPSTLLCKGEHR